MSPYRLQFTFYRLARTIRCGISHSAYAKLLLTVGHKDWVQPIKRLLAVKGWTQGDLAEHAKIRPTTLSAAMNGRPPRMQTMEAIAAAFGVPLWALFVNEHQAALLTKHQVAETALAREEEITARVEQKIMARIANMVREETASELAGPKPLEAPPVKKKKRA
jgi:transcriptional regulator with XRE-family HTH domain